MKEIRVKNSLFFNVVALMVQNILHTHNSNYSYLDMLTVIETRPETVHKKKLFFSLSLGIGDYRDSFLLHKSSRVVPVREIALNNTKEKTSE